MRSDSRKKIIEKYYRTWIQVDKNLGVSLNQEDAYWTYKDEFIEREWKLLKHAYENGILTEGKRVVAYCPSCLTSLSHSEVNQGYHKVKDPSLFYKVKLVDEDKFLIVWTTMPFTLVTDAMIGTNPKEEYVEVKVENEIWVVGKIRLEEFMQEIKIEDYQVLKTMLGSELEEKKYNTLQNCHKYIDYYIHAEKNIFSEKIKFSGDGNDFRKWLEKNWKEVYESYSWRFEQ